MGNIIKRLRKEKEVTPEMKPLSLEQIQIIRRTYVIPASRLFDFGEHVFFNYLERYI